MSEDDGAKPEGKGSGKDAEARWESVYEQSDVESLPWFYPDLDPDFEQALKRYAVAGGRMLDLCTGPGTQALAMAERGFDVTAMDIASTALEKACLRASEKGLKIEYAQGDILRGDPGGVFDLVFDRGCYHIFRKEQRVEYVDAVADLVRAGGYLFLKCFSIKEKRRAGPYHIAPQEIESNFSGRFELVSIEESEFPGAMGKPLPKALFCVMRKKD